MLDNTAEKLLLYVEQTNAFIESSKQMGGSVLVHCVQGKSRAPSIVAAYVMKNMHLGHEGALAFVKSKHGRAAPNDAFRRQLEEYGRYLRPSRLHARRAAPRRAGPLATARARSRSASRERVAG